MEKINIAELLYNCPKGMELDCTMYEDVTLFGVNDRENTIFPIRVLRKDGSSLELTKYGQYADADFAKCVIFPKGKTTWEGFVPPCQFKDGDILYINFTDEDDNNQYEFIFIFNKIDNNKIYSHCHYYMSNNHFHPKVEYLSDNTYPIRFATEEEKEKLFDAIKNKGYKWNAETKTLEKLTKPKFKVGDRIKKDKDYISGIVTSISDDGDYKVEYQGGGVSYINPAYQDEWELVPNKFDITTLKPFDKVLVRDDDSEEWTPNFYGYKRREFQCVLNNWHQCIPYKENEHLLCTIEDCDEFYKNW